MGKNAKNPEAQQKSPEARYEDPMEKKEAWWTDARKVLLTHILTLLLTPASVAVTYYLTESYKAPLPQIEYVTAIPYYFSLVPPRSLADRINKEPRLAWGFRDELRKSIISLQDYQTCISWLDGDHWDSKCEPVYKSVAIQMRGMLQTMIQQMKQGRPTQPHLSPSFELLLPEANRAFKVVDDFVKELIELQSQSRSRSGDVDITIGVMNRGASDGVIFKNAILKFIGQTFQVSAKEYVAIKAHSFAEVTFVSAREEDGQFFGTRRVGEEKVIKTWSDLVKKGDEIPFELTVTLSDKTTSIKGEVPKEY